MLTDRVWPQEPGAGILGADASECVARFAWFTTARRVVVLVAVPATTTFLGFSVLTFLPIFAQKVFHEGAGTYSRLSWFRAPSDLNGNAIWPETIASVPRCNSVSDSPS